MNNNTRKEMVRARDALETTIAAFNDLAYSYHNGLRGEMKDDFASMATDLQQAELRQLVLTAQAMGEPTYTKHNTSYRYDAGSGQTVLWYHHTHPDTGECIYHRIATRYPDGRLVLSDTDPAITTEMADDLIRYHEEQM